MNIANRITMFRIILAFVFIFLIFSSGLWAKAGALIVFIVAAISDFLDGYIAHKRNLVTDFGKIMDPIADKVLVLSAFTCFVQMQLIESWMFVVIILRELLITSLRLFALSKGHVVAASKAGKHKTVSQLAVIIFILIFIVAKEAMLEYATWNPAWEKFFLNSIFVMMLVTVGFTLFSGFSYLWENRKMISRN